MWILIQNGLQPIHFAAQIGHEDVIKLLVENFNIRPDAANSVKN